MARDESGIIAPAPYAQGSEIRPAAYVPPVAVAGTRRWRPSPRFTGVAILLAAFAVVAWFLLTARAVHVTTDPEGATVQIDTGINVHVAGRFLLHQGEHVLTAEAEGYRTHREAITVGPGYDQDVVITLEKLPGSLRVDTVPQGATVIVDGEERGFSPVLVEQLSAGSHTVSLRHPRFLPADQPVDIEGLGRSQSIAIPLAPAWADIHVTSTPEGAEVLVDEAPSGSTPLTAEVLQGARTLRVQKSGFKAHQQVLQVVAGQDQELPVIVLQPADATLVVDSRPQGASVTLDGGFQGRTPVELAMAPGKRGIVRLFKDGYAPTEREVRLATGERRTLTVTLDADMVDVEIRAEPVDAELAIDGTARGLANQVIRLNTSPHRLRIHKPGYVPWESTITPRAGNPQLVQVTLLTEEAARRAAIKPEITTAAGQRMKLLEPGGDSFMLGASRREPGRRANEALRSVTLTRSFYLAVTEVTNAEFKAFDPTHDSGSFQQKSLDGANQPVVKVTWQQAALFCNWLSTKDGLQPFYQVRDGRVIGATPGAAGYRLPTEAEWEWAARRQGGGMARFAWGEALPPPQKAGNFADQSAVGIVAQVLEKYQDGFPVSAPVGSFAANGRGLRDMDGNVAEWVHDWYDVPVEQTTPMVDPLGPASGQHRVIRGASFAHGSLTELRLSFRDYGVDARDDVGFRIARYVE